MKVTDKLHATFPLFLVR